MADPTAIGHVKWGFEATYGTESTQLNKAFGHGVRISDLSGSNSIKRTRGLGSRNAERLDELGFEGAVSAEFDLSSPWFLRPVLGSAAVAGSSPYTHTFSESDTVESITVLDEVNTDTDSIRSLLGAKINQMTVTAAVGETARVKLDMPFQTEGFDSTTSARTAESFDSFTFAQGSLDLPSGTTLSFVQSAEAVLTNNMTRIPGLGSRFTQAQTPQERDHTITTNLAFSDSSETLEVFYGGSTGPADIISESATAVLTFDNGLTSTNKRAITFTYTGVKIDEESMPQDPAATIFEDLTLFARSLTVTADNNTATIP